ncbi:MAG: CoB--CoM heterodisulfide reductase iron-sulfur subunit B family protein [Candidatus Eiseniibacteriota bacterium]|nr:MAG: CoB--CoM heterodisulfide reductase iron-sulfur subunit B family protein [Candidatus Eisenbacteria bacterium]
MKCLYYPGCSQKGTSRSYEESLFAISSKLGVSLHELEDWNCCGTTSVVAVNKVLSLALAARNLALAEPEGLPLVTPCPSCWLSLTRANRVIKEGGPLAEKVRVALAAGGLSYNGGTVIRHLMEFMVNEIGLERIGQCVSTHLTGLRVAPYYGCQVVRPYAGEDDPYDPQNLEKLIDATGALPVSFELKTACCGGAMMATRKDIGRQMSDKILQGARTVEADLVVTPCPLCQLNLELAEYKNGRWPWEEAELPVLNLTQFLGLAMDVSPEKLALSRSIVPGVKRSVTGALLQTVSTTGE